jgi:hypothetical protein
MRNTWLAGEADYFDAASPELAESHARARAEGFKTSVFQLGDSVADNPPVAVMLYLPPGGVLYRHRHDCHRWEVVVQGSLTTEDGRVLNPGDVRISKPGEFYGPHTAGPSGVLCAEIFSSVTGLKSEGDPEHPAAALTVPKG